MIVLSVYRVRAGHRSKVRLRVRVYADVGLLSIHVQWGANLSRVTSESRVLHVFHAATRACVVEVLCANSVNFVVPVHIEEDAVSRVLGVDFVRAKVRTFVSRELTVRTHVIVETSAIGRFHQFLRACVSVVESA